MFRLLTCTLALAATGAHAITIDAFRGPEVITYYDANRPATAVLRADMPGYLPGVTRTLQINPDPALPGVSAMEVHRPYVVGPVERLMVSSTRGQPTSGTLSYGLDVPMNLDLSAEWAFVLHAEQADPFTLTAYAWTEAARPGDNPLGSALTLAVGRLDDAAVVLPFAAFRQNGGAPVRWDDVDRLQFAFSGPTDSYVFLTSISTVSALAPVPEPAAAVLLATGLAGLVWRARRPAGT